MVDVRAYSTVVLRPQLTDERNVPLGSVVTHHYHGVGYLTPLIHGRTKLWHIGVTAPRLEGHWVDLKSVSVGGFISKREALASLSRPQSPETEMMTRRQLYERFSVSALRHYVIALGIKPGDIQEYLDKKVSAHRLNKEELVNLHLKLDEANRGLGELLHE